MELNDLIKCGMALNASQREELSKLHTNIAETKYKSAMISASLIFLDMEVPPCCTKCGGVVEFVSKTKSSESRTTPYGGWRDFCSSRCMRTSDKIKEQKSKTYSNNKPSHKKRPPLSKQELLNQKKKTIESNLERYGVEWYSQLETRRSHLSENNPFKLGEVKEKSKKTMLSKYGHEHALQSKEIRDKIAETLLERYGVDNVSKLPQNKIKLTERCRTHYDPKFIEVLQEDLKGLREYLLSIATKEDTRRTLADKIGCSVSKLNAFMRIGGCSDMFVGSPSFSSFEKEVLYFIKTLDEDVIRSDRTILNGKEIDIVSHKHKIGIECNGVYHHSEDMGKDELYHVTKTNRANEQGYKLFHVLDSDWYNKTEIVKSMLSSVFGANKRKIAARKCTIRYVPKDECERFLEENHLQGHAQSSIRLGLYHEEELVSVMTFGKPRYNKSYQYELIRSCHLKNTTVQGGVTKLFQHFIKTHNPTNVICYSDRFLGGLEPSYSLFMKLENVTPPSWRGFYKSDYTPMHRSNFMKHKLSKMDGFDPERTALENMRILGIGRIWDCGQYVYSWPK